MTLAPVDASREILGYRWTDFTGRIVHQAKAPPPTGAYNLEPFYAGELQQETFELTPEQIADCTPSSATMRLSDAPGESRVVLSFAECKEFGINMLLMSRGKRLQGYAPSLSPEQLWEGFIAHLNKARPLPDEAPHKNFLGSVAAYKQLFLESSKNHLEQKS